MEVLFHVFDRKAFRRPKDVSARDDSVRDFVYCLQPSLVLTAQRSFPWLLRSPRREKPRRHWTLLYLHRSLGERQGAGTVPGLFRAVLPLRRLSREGDGSWVWFPRPLATSYSCLASSLCSRVRPGSDPRLSTRPTFRPPHSKTSCKVKHIKCPNWLFHSS